MGQLKFKFGTNRNPIIADFKEFNGRKIADIRKFYPDKIDQDVLLPTRKGISLNVSQLGQLIETLNSNSSDISKFFSASNNQAIEIGFTPTIGRSVKVNYENNEIFVVLDETFKSKLDNKEIIFFSRLLEAFISSINEIVEDQEEIDLILDTLNYKIIKNL